MKSYIIEEYLQIFTDPQQIFLRKNQRWSDEMCLCRFYLSKDFLRAYENCSNCFGHGKVPIRLDDLK